MFQVVEFDDNSVGVIHKSWSTRPGYTFWPSLKDQKKLDDLVKSGKPVPKGSREYAVKFHRANDDFKTAMKFQRMLEIMSEIPSTEATAEMLRTNKRKAKPVMNSDFTDEEDDSPSPKALRLDIDYSPPPPPLFDMSNIDTQTRAVHPNPTAKSGRSFLSSTARIISPMKENVQPEPVAQPVASTSYISSCCKKCPHCGNTIPQEKTDSRLLDRKTFTDEMSVLYSRIEMQAAVLQEMQHHLMTLRFQNANRQENKAPELPVNLPMKTVTDLLLLNDKLSDINVRKQLQTYLSTVGGPSYGECTRNILSAMFTDKLADNINWRGVNNRISISGTPVALAIVDAVMDHNYPGCTQAAIREKIQRWIQRARRRDPNFTKATTSAAEAQQPERPDLQCLQIFYQ